MKTCPQCAEDVKEAAKVCRYCGYSFDGTRGGGDIGGGRALAVLGGAAVVASLWLPWYSGVLHSKSLEGSKFQSDFPYEDTLWSLHTVTSLVLVLVIGVCLGLLAVSRRNPRVLYAVEAASLVALLIVLVFSGPDGADSDQTQTVNAELGFYIGLAGVLAVLAGTLAVHASALRGR